MSASFSTISRLANRTVFFNPIAAEVGFNLAGEIDRFIFSVYGKALKAIQPADRPRGSIFVLEPAAITDALGTPAVFKPMLGKIQADTTKTFHSIRADLSGGLSIAYACTPEDRKSLVSGGWSLQIALQYSRDTKKCVVWAMGVGVHVYLNGHLYLESIDVIEELAMGLPGNFQNLSWDDGGIAFEFARHELNDASAGGIWHLPDKCLLSPKPEALIRSCLGDFLRFRLASYHHHDEEPHVEHEGRADISLHLIDNRVLIIEVKWMGCSLVAARQGETDDAIKQAIAKNATGWFTRFDEKTITSGIKQLVSYYKTGKYRKAYLTVFDCTESAKTTQSCYVPVPEAELDDHNQANFRILHACVDPRSASKRAKR
mgnify:CR=1 FL=1